MKELKFFLITDTHYFKNSIGAYGPEYEEYMTTQQKCYAETEAIDREVIRYLCESKEADIVLIAGDLTFNGEKESHEEFSKLLGELKASGKKIYVVTAAHDISDHPFAYRGGERESVEGIKFDDLLGYYHEFGYDDAIAFNREHMSYVAQLGEGVRLLVLCNDTSEGHSLEYSDEFYAWVEEQCRKAKEDGQMMFAMEHYPVIAGQPILQLIGDARQKGAAKLIQKLADNDVHLIFTGHMHNQSVNVEVTEKGNKFYDVCTGSVIGCPAFMRLCTIKDPETIEIKSIPIPDFEWDTNGRSCTQYLQDLFDGMIRGYILGLKEDPKKTLGKIGVKEPSGSVVKIAQKAGSFLSSVTLGKLCRLLWTKADPEVKDDKFLDIAVALVRNAFCGDQPFTDKTPEGRTLLRAFKKMSPLFKVLNKKLHGSQGEQVDLYDMLKNTAGNYDLPDGDVVLKLK